MNLYAATVGAMGQSNETLGDGLTSMDATELNLPSVLRPYQWEGVRFLVDRESALLADEMGLGKTVQTSIALRLLLKQSGCDRALIVTPASLRLNWERELARWAPELAVRRVQGSIADRRNLYRLPIPVLIASYEQVRADVQTMRDSTRFDIVVLDEAQRIKNASSSTTLACRLLPRSRAWALSGTPVENRAEDLVSLFRFLKPGLVSRGLPRHELHRRIQPCFLRRNKSEVLGDLPPMIVQDVPLELDGQQRFAYQRLWDARGELLSNYENPGSPTSLLALITMLKQVCNFDKESGESVKLDALEAIIDSLQGSHDKVLIFSQYVETLDWLSDRLSHIPHDIFHGGLSELERDTVASAFELANGPRALLVSIKAGGTGLNLPSASTVVLFDRWWNPAVEAQAINRAHRFGRTTTLHVIRFLVSESIEQRIAEILATKHDLFGCYVEEAANATVRLFSHSELLEMLDLSTPAVDVSA